MNQVGHKRCGETPRTVASSALVLHVRSENCLRFSGKSWGLTVYFFLTLLLFFFLTAERGHSSQVRLVDEVGREVVIPFPPKRIVSLAPNITEILFSLGLDEEIVGVSIHCDFPDKAKTRVRVGSYISLDFERILSLHPDLIIATGAGNTREMVDRLEKFGFSVYVIFPRNFDDILSSIIHIGQVVGREGEAEEIILGMKRRKERVTTLTRDLPRPRIFLQIGDVPIITVGSGGFADHLISLAGGENIAKGEKGMYPRWGMEEIIKRSPEVILISTHNPHGDYRKVLEEWARWKILPAVKEGRIHLINSDLIDRPSPRIVEGLEEMAKALHPEQFRKPIQNQP
jgi:iron complex transport system substrate-binding protein